MEYLSKCSSFNFYNVYLHYLFLSTPTNQIENRNNFHDYKRKTTVLQKQ